MYRIRSLIVLCLCLVISFIVGCIEVNLPSTCDNLNGEPSIICSLKEEYGLIRPEGVGNIFIAVNAVAIKNGTFTKHDIQSVVMGLLQITKSGNITYEIFQAVLKEYIEDYPGLLEVAQGYMDVFDIDKQIYPKDLEIIRTELNRILLNI